MNNEKKVPQSDSEWKKLLTPQEYHILREKGTERAFTGAYWDHHETGSYVCGACKQKLFSSTDKFDSGTGWPSFSRPYKPCVVLTQNDDFSVAMERAEVVCAQCHSHLGHVFSDGPTAPDHHRYCINSGSLKFQTHE